VYEYRWPTHSYLIGREHGGETGILVRLRVIFLYILVTPWSRLPRLSGDCAGIGSTMRLLRMLDGQVMDYTRFFHRIAMFHPSLFHEMVMVRHLDTKKRSNIGELWRV
jgi:hypothetical protein